MRTYWACALIGLLNPNIHEILFWYQQLTNNGAIGSYRCWSRQCYLFVRREHEIHNCGYSKQPVWSMFFGFHFQTKSLIGLNKSSQIGAKTKQFEGVKKRSKSNNSAHDQFHQGPPWWTNSTMYDSFCHSYMTALSLSIGHRVCHWHRWLKVRLRVAMIYLNARNMACMYVLCTFVSYSSGPVRNFVEGEASWKLESTMHGQQQNTL